MSFAVGSLVKARGREWVVLPKSGDEMLILRPLGGTDDETTGIYLPLESVQSAEFGLPDPTKPGDYRSARLLRDAVRLGFRSSAGPFRSFAKIAVEPRPYQLVPLLLALKLDPVRILIADDVGIGKTIESALIARELLDRGEINRMAVVCPPPLAEQWQAELADKFHLDAELVLPGTVTRLERHCRLGQSLFERYPFVIVSTDFIKSDRRRDEFLRTCPELVIVDEAHTCVSADEESSRRHQRHKLVAGLAADASRHLILVTATPHSGKEAAFRALLELLNKDFANLPVDLSGKENESHRRALAAQFVQRRRADIRSYLDAETPFPDREESEAQYELSEDYKKLFAKVLDFARESVLDAQENRWRQRVRWWSALALLRSLSSSPAAAAATLRNRAAVADTDTLEEADEIGRRVILDLVEDEAAEGGDISPGSSSGDETSEVEQKLHRRLLAMAREAEGLTGKKDVKLQQAVKLIKSVLSDGFNPIVFCRFIPTATYVAKVLREELPDKIEVVEITGQLPPAERKSRIEEIDQSAKRVLVCTDCLSEGINLQECFNAVIHYDLAWNPTRHEQREGRVDRYGQASKKVRMLTLYGIDNQIDGIVLDVLIRKHKAIRNSLGISVPVPVDTEKVVEAIFEGLLLREQTAGGIQTLLPGFEEFFKPQKEALHGDWQDSAEREKRSLTMFAQQSIKVDEVARELAEMRAAVGAGTDVRRFMIDALKAHNAVISESNDAFTFDIEETPQSLKDLLGTEANFTARFEKPVEKEQLYLSRTHPIVENLGTYVLNTALDLEIDGVARRCGVVRTEAVDVRTTLLLVRFRYHIITHSKGAAVPLLAEDARLLGFAGAPGNAQWLARAKAEELLGAVPSGNVSSDQAAQFISLVLDHVSDLDGHIQDVAEERGEELLAAHTRVRAAAKAKGTRHSVKPHLPADILGIYVYLPAS